MAKRQQRQTHSSVIKVEGSLSSSPHALCLHIDNVMLAMRLSCRMPTRIEAAARFYELTKTSRRQLLAETDQWRRLATAIGRILGPNEA